MHRFNDIHTHTAGQSGSVLSAPPSVAMALAKENPEDQYYSLELHPWYVSQGLVNEFLTAMERCQGDPHLVAIGECGLDPHSQAPMQEQRKALNVALRIAQSKKLPVIIHCVSQWAELIAAHREFPDVQMIVHGFRKGWPLAQQLLHEGIALSLGEKYHPEVAARMPKELLYYETDESVLNICEIKEKILSLRSQ